MRHGACGYVAQVDSRGLVHVLDHGGVPDGHHLAHACEEEDMRYSSKENARACPIDTCACATYVWTKPTTTSRLFHVCRHCAMEPAQRVGPDAASVTRPHREG